MRPEVRNQTTVYLHHQTGTKERQSPSLFSFYLSSLFLFLNLPALHSFTFSERTCEAEEIWIYQLHLMAYCPPEDDKEII